MITGFAPTQPVTAICPRPAIRRRYYDDNAWIGLCFAQLHLQTGEARWLRRARKVFRFVREGQDPDGGMRWVERRRARHTCSAAPAAQLALRLHLADSDDEALAFARRTLSWLDGTLRGRGGLYADYNVDARGRVQRSLWTYNQGAPVGALWSLHVATGDEGALERARATASASLDGSATSGRGGTHRSSTPCGSATYSRSTPRAFACSGSLPPSTRTSRAPGGWGATTMGGSPPAASALTMGPPRSTLEDSHSSTRCGPGPGIADR